MDFSVEKLGALLLGAAIGGLCGWMCAPSVQGQASPALVISAIGGVGGAIGIELLWRGLNWMEERQRRPGMKGRRGG